MIFFKKDHVIEEIFTLSKPKFDIAFNFHIISAYLVSGR